MAVHNFRGAFHGFNREDVVRYIEYTSNKHADQLNQLRGENQNLLNELDTLRAAMAKQAELVAQLEAAQAQLADANAQLEAAKAQREADQVELEQLREQAAGAAQALAKEELEAYRRAEKAERAAKERAAQLYRQATGTLADAATHIDTAAGNFRQVAERMNDHMLELQAAVDASKNALLDASDLLCAIRPQATEE